MPAHPVGSATVSFGLVSIPVKLYSASQPSATISFNLLHKKCGGRMKQQYVCPKDDEIVPREDMAKGYEYSKGQYVIFSKEELEAIEEKASGAIDVTEFLSKEKIDPVYFDKPYYLAPEKGGERAYRLLSKAMEESGRWAVGKYAARGKQYLVVVRPMNGGLTMQQLHYAEEVRPFSDVGVFDTEVRDAELALAMQLLDAQTSTAFHPEAYHDDSKQRLEEMIEKKVQGQEITLVAEEPKTQVIDLMEALKASLAARGATRSGSGEGSGGAGGSAAGGNVERMPAKRAPREEREEAAGAKAPRKRASK